MLVVTRPVVVLVWALGLVWVHVWVHVLILIWPLVWSLVWPLTWPTTCISIEIALSHLCKCKKLSIWHKWSTLRLPVLIPLGSHPISTIIRWLLYNRGATFRNCTVLLVVEVQRLLLVGGRIPLLHLLLFFT